MAYQVFTKEGSSLAVCSDLNTAMDAARASGQFVRIVGADGMEIVGKFGVDGITDGRTTDGHIYEWKKEFSLKRRKNDMKAAKR